MARREEREKAIELRIQGKSYSEIKTILGISKSTLSGWLQKYPLTGDQIARIKENRPRQIEKFRQTMTRKREIREKFAYDEAKKNWLPLSDRELQLAGIFLYWGEGTKVSSSYVCISNCDPKVVKFAIYWLVKGLNISPTSIRVLLHLYSDMIIEEEIKFWQEVTNLPLQNFRKPYIKNSTRAGLTYKSFGHGTCNVYTSDVTIKTRILKSIEAISDYHSSLI